MDGDLGNFDAESRTASALAETAPPQPRAPERIAALYRRMVAGRGAKLALPDLAGCYDYDL